MSTQHQPEPRGFLFGDFDLPTIWSVDDEWSEGEATVFNILPLAELNNDLALLSNEITDAQQLGVGSPAMLGYLKTLSELCVKNRLSLLICNFEYFAAKFALANRPTNAVLLDVHYGSYSGPQFGITNQPERRKVYGLYLLADLLKGQRFLGEIFFVTNNPEHVFRELSANDGKREWWPIRAISGCTVNKLDLSSRSLEPFFNYFVHGLPPELKAVDYDIKFIVQVPLAALVGRLTPQYVHDFCESNGSNPYPFLIPLIKEFGMAAPLRESGLAFINNPRYGPRVARAVSKELRENSDRWDKLSQWIGSQNEEQLTHFLTNNSEIDDLDPLKTYKLHLRNAYILFLKSVTARSDFDSHLTLQDWINAICLPRLSEILKELVDEFGGETRFEFARGRWISDTGQPVEDMLLVVEFLAMHSKVSREMIEREIVHKLLNDSDEDAAIIQEIPVRGFMHNRL